MWWYDQRTSGKVAWVGPLVLSWCQYVPTAGGAASTRAADSFRIDVGRTDPGRALDLRSNTPVTGPVPVEYTLWQRNNGLHVERGGNRNLSEPGSSISAIPIVPISRPRRDYRTAPVPVPASARSLLVVAVFRPGPEAQHAQASSFQS